MIEYPHNPPTSPGYKRISYLAKSVTGVSQTPFSLAQQVQDHLGEAWAVEVELPPMTRVEAEPWIAWRLALRGRLGTFELRLDASARLPRGAISTSPVADSVGSPSVNGVRASELHLRGLGNNVSGVFKAGDFFCLEVGGFKRLHKVLQDVSSNGSGRAVVDVFPRLRGDVPDGTEIIWNDPRGTFRMNGNEAPWEVGDASFYGLGFTAFEMLP